MQPQCTTPRTGGTTTQQQASIQQALINIVSAETSALISLIEHFPSNAWRIVEQILATHGKVIFSGVGKSGLVAQKLAATCSSLGIPAFSLNPNDALHGDIGAVQQGDFFLALSKSASGEEFNCLLPLLAARSVPTGLICCKQGPLAQKADIVIVLPLEREACPLNLAPSSSSTLMMAFGDALAIVASSIKGFGPQDFARYHPAGTLGRRLLFTVSTLMHRGTELPLIKPDTTFKDMLLTITSKKLGLGIVVDANNVLQGIITDGDLRRACELGPNVFTIAALDIATKHPKTISPHILAVEALEIMEKYNITSLVVVEHEKVVGLLHIHDVIRAGL